MPILKNQLTLKTPYLKVLWSTPFDVDVYWVKNFNYAKHFKLLLRLWRKNFYIVKLYIYINKQKEAPFSVAIYVTFSSVYHSPSGL
jgi:hypothetical protein